MTDPQSKDHRSLPEYPRYEPATRTLIVSSAYFDHMQRLAQAVDQREFEDLQHSLCSTFHIAPGLEVKVQVVPYE
jgi:hypothetical protein